MMVLPHPKNNLFVNLAKFKIGYQNNAKKSEAIVRISAELCFLMNIAIISEGTGKDTQLLIETELAFCMANQ